MDLMSSSNNISTQLIQDTSQLINPTCSIDDQHKFNHNCEDHHTSITGINTVSDSNESCIVLDDHMHEANLNSVKHESNLLLVNSDSFHHHVNFRGYNVSSDCTLQNMTGISAHSAHLLLTADGSDRTIPSSENELIADPIEVQPCTAADKQGISCTVCPNMATVSVTESQQDSFGFTKSSCGQNVVVQANADLCANQLNKNRKKHCSVYPLLGEHQLSLTTLPATDELSMQSLTNLGNDAPEWAERMHDCIACGDYYRGYVKSEPELNYLLTLHRKLTNSCWGTRQSPSLSKPSIRYMWRSQYVPYDGIPFLNSGRRAIVMECQFGPRRRCIQKRGLINSRNSALLKDDHLQSCPARIYVKKVQKFPQFKVSTKLSGKSIRQAQERSLSALRQSESDLVGDERYYVRLPTIRAHKYHHIENNLGINMSIESIRLQSSYFDNRVLTKLQEIVAQGNDDVNSIKQLLKNFVENELFSQGTRTLFDKQVRCFYPSTSDLDSLIHQAKSTMISNNSRNNIAHNLSSLPLDMDAEEYLRHTSMINDNNRCPKVMNNSHIAMTSSVADEPLSILQRNSDHCSPSVTASVSSYVPSGIESSAVQPVANSNNRLVIVSSMPTSSISAIQTICSMPQSITKEAVSLIS